MNEMTPDKLGTLLDDVGYSVQIVAKPPTARRLDYDLEAAASAWEADRARIEALEKRRVEDFVAGAKWWEYDRENATMWQSDQERAASAAEVHFRAQALREAALTAKEMT